MSDYGRPLRFGFFIDPTATLLANSLRVADLADGHGIDLLGVQDHPYQARYLDAWALIGGLLAGTERVSVFPDVASLPLRPPATLAKLVASLDLMSGGRVELGLGAGAFWDAIAAMGGPRRTPQQAGGALAEAVDVIRALWSGQRSVRYDGKHYRLDGVHPGPRPAHDVGIWLGVGGPKMLALVGRAADGWVPSASYFPPDKLPDMHARIDESAHAVDRDPSSITRIYNVFGTITGGESRGDFEGPVEQWIDTLTELVIEAGMDSFVFGTAGDELRQLQTFADEVAPAVRERVAQERD